MLGYASTLRTEFARWRVVYTSATDVWRIYDLQSEALQSITSIDDEIPDDSPAVMVLPGQAVRALLEELSRLDMIDYGKTSSEPRNDPSLPKQDMDELMSARELDLKKYHIDALVSTSDKHQLDALIQLAGIYAREDTIEENVEDDLGGLTEE